MTQRIVCFATQGTGSLDERRITGLLEGTPAELWALPRPFARHTCRLTLRLVRERPALCVMEGTGLRAGIPLILASLAGLTRYVVSSGDAVGPYYALRSRWLTVPGALYERLLYRRAAGVIGWTPYLTGRALTLGARRAMTAPGAGLEPTAGDPGLRASLGLDGATVVFGLVGSLRWSARRGYAYGAELIRALAASSRRDLAVVVVGDGTGRARLQALAESLGVGDRVRLPGRVPPGEIPRWLALFDVASLPQSVDAVGSFRYSTKLAEYVSAGLPVVTGQLPFAYDLDSGWLWRLPGDAPWDAAYVAGLTTLMDEIGPEDIADRAAAARRGRPEFDAEAQQRRVAAFIADVLA